MHKSALIIITAAVSAILSTSVFISPLPNQAAGKLLIGEGSLPLTPLQPPGHNQLSQPAVKILKWVCENSGKLPIPSNLHNEIQNTCLKVVGQKLTAEVGGGYQTEGPSANAPGGGGGYQTEGPSANASGGGGYQPRP